MEIPKRSHSVVVLEDAAQSSHDVASQPVKQEVDEFRTEVLFTSRPKRSMCSKITTNCVNFTGETLERFIESICILH